MEETPSGHYAINLIKEQEVITNEINDSYYSKSKDEKYEKSKIIHRITAHKTEEPMCRLFKNAGKLDTETKEAIIKVVTNCKVCNKYHKTRDMPKVGMPKANDTNEVVSLDLKEMRDDGKHILYMVDEFSRYTRAEVIKSKDPSAVMRAIEDSWIHRGPGWPAKGFFSDRGGELEVVNFPTRK